MKKFLMTLLSCVFATAAAFAQGDELDYKPFPHAFISVQGGAQSTFTNVPFTDLITPIGAVSVGGYFEKGVGARVNVQGWMNKSGYSLANTDLTYKFNYLNTNIDLLLNLTNLFSKKEWHRFNVVLFGGFGLAYAWDNDEQNALIASHDLGYAKGWTGDDVISHSVRAGLQMEYNVSKHWGINLEVVANNFDDDFNAKFNNTDDWSVAALVGVSYKFGFGKKKVAPTPVPSTPAPAPAPKPTPAPAPAPAPAPKPEEPAPAPAPKPKKDVEVFFTINSAVISTAEEKKVAELAAWLKQHPEAKVTLTGYADAGTGTATINRNVSKKRVNSVSKMLTEKYGVDKSRIKTDFKGDTVQPFADNDKNRVTIGVAE